MKYKRKDYRGIVFLRNNIIPFFGENKPFGFMSNFYNLKFKPEFIKHEFKSSEQLFMYIKAIYFNDKEAANKILSASSPKESKSLGRSVRNYKDKDWNIVSSMAMLFSVFYKFNSSEDLKKKLLSTKDKILIEASPYDARWGVKLNSNESFILEVDEWRGENRLGFTLMEVRDLLKENKLPLDALNFIIKIFNIDKEEVENYIKCMKLNIDEGNQLRKNR